MLYSSVIGERFRHPRFFGDLDRADAMQMAQESPLKRASAMLPLPSRS